MSKNFQGFSKFKNNMGSVNARGWVLIICMAAFSILFTVKYLVNSRNSPIAQNLKLVDLLLVNELRKSVEDPRQLELELASNFSTDQICLIAITCKLWANASTSDPIGSFEDVERLKSCFCACLKVLKAKGATSKLRKIYLEAQISDGWMILWTESLGARWLELNKGGQPEN